MPAVGVAVGMLVASACAILSVSAPVGALGTVSKVGSPHNDPIISLSAGHAHECAILATRNVECWGWNFYGQLGDRSTNPSGSPVLIPDLSGVRHVAAGFAHTCALFTSGTVSCWGWNANGQLGDGTEHNALSPVGVRGLHGALEITAGFEHTCALLGTHRVQCWGWNFYGQVGDGSQATRQQPVTVRGLSHVADVVAGYGHTCARLENRTVQCWGWGTSGQLGDGRDRNSAVPVPVRGLHGVVQLTLGYAGTCALLDTGKVACWGRNNLGQLGDGSRAGSSVPVMVPGLGGVRQLAAGFGHVCAMRTTSGVVCWGFNQDGQLGVGDRQDRTSPTPTATLRGVIQVTAQDDDTCVLLVVHAYSCWGLGHDGELGNGHLGGGVRADVMSPPFLPSSPRAAHAIAQGATALVRWRAPVSPGAGGVSTYLARAVDRTNPARGGEECRWRAGPLRCTVFNLTFGDLYSFKVSAQSAVGSGRAAATPFVVPITSPDTPTGVTADPSNGTAMVHWLAPSFDGGSTIHHYVARATDQTTPANGGETCIWTKGPLQCRVVGLTNGDQYTFAVTASNRAGHSSPSPSSGAVTPATAPSAPLDVQATPSNASATVQWSQPPDGGSPIIGYAVLAVDTTNVDNGGQSCASTQLSCDVTGLTNGDDYTFSVTAHNAAGTSSAAVSNAVKPVTVPDAPTNVVATPSARSTPGAGSALVTWNAPNAQGSPITGYAVTASDQTNGANGGQTCSTSGSPPATQCTVPGLTNGDVYTFQVTATNAQGNSAASAPSSGAEPKGVPDAPTNVQVQPGNAQALVSWSAPASDGGVAITQYTVTATSAGQPVETCTWSSGNLSCTVGSLTNGDQYAFTVTATNSLGTSAASTAADATPATVPDPPSISLIQPGNGQATVTWSAPDTNGGSAITGYTVTANPENQSDSVETCSWGGDPGNLSCTVGSLTNGDTYDVTVVATNGVGTSQASASEPVVPATTPDAPQSVVAVPGIASATVSWSAPASDGGSPITAYTVTADDLTASNPNAGQCTWSGDPSNLSCTVSNLTTGDTVQFTVVATNNVGDGPASTPSHPVLIG